MGDIEEKSGGSQVSPPFGRHDQETWLDRNQRHRAVEALGCVLSEGVVFCPQKQVRKTTGCRSQKRLWMVGTVD